MSTSKEIFKIDWKGVQSELANVPSLLSSSLDPSDPNQGLDLLENVSESIINSTYFLLHGVPCSTDAAYERNQSPFAIRPSLHCARSEIFSWFSSNVLAYPQQRTSVSPVVILVTDSLLYYNTPVESLDELSRGCFMDYPSNCLPDDPFLWSWGHICKDRSQIFTVVPQSSLKMRSTVEAILESSVHEIQACSALVVLHISCDSFISSDLSMLRETCISKNALFLVEGAGLSLLAQENLPGDPKSCWNAADFFIIDPASWFGFDDCAVISIQRIHNRYYEFKPFYSTSISSVVSQNDFPHALVSVVKLWTLISRVGSDIMRFTVDRVTTLAESFVHYLRNSPNLETSYEGVACVVQVSYTLSRDDRLLPLERGRQLISTANDAIFTSLEDHAAPLGLLKGNGEHGIFMHFSPARLLSWDSSSLPNISDIKNFAHALQDAADRYEICRVGSAAFVSRVIQSDNIEVIDEADRTADLSLSFGAFRVIPTGKGRIWRKSEEDIITVTELTSALATELSYNAEYGVSENPGRDNVTNERSTSPIGWKEGNSIIFDSTTVHDFESDKSEASGEHSKNHPFVFYFHSQVENGVSDFISVEPKAPTMPVSAVRQAYSAAELIISSAQTVVEKWTEELSTDMPHSTNTVMNRLHFAQEDEEQRAASDDKRINTHLRTSPLQKDTFVINRPVISPSVESCSDDEFVSAKSGSENTVIGSKNQVACPLSTTVCENNSIDMASIEDPCNATELHPTDFYDEIAIGDYGPLDTVEDSSVHSGSRRSEISEIPTEVRRASLDCTPSIYISESSRERTGLTASKETGWLRFWRTKKLQKGDKSATKGSTSDKGKSLDKKASNLCTGESGRNQVIHYNRDSSESANYTESSSPRFIEGGGVIDSTNNYEGDLLVVVNSEIEPSLMSHTRIDLSRSGSKLEPKYRGPNINSLSDSDNWSCSNDSRDVISSQTEWTATTTVSGPASSDSTEMHRVEKTEIELGVTSAVRYPHRMATNLVNWFKGTNEKQDEATKQPYSMNINVTIDTDDSCEVSPEITERVKSSLLDRHKQDDHIRKFNKHKKYSSCEKSEQKTSSRPKSNRRIGSNDKEHAKVHLGPSNKRSPRLQERWGPVLTGDYAESGWGPNNFLRWFQGNATKDKQVFAVRETPSPSQLCSSTKSSSSICSLEDRYASPGLSDSCSKTILSSGIETMDRLEFSMSNQTGLKSTKSVKSDATNSFLQAEELKPDKNIRSRANAGHEQELLFRRSKVRKQGSMRPGPVSVTSQNTSLTVDHEIEESHKHYYKSELEQYTSRTISSESERQITDNSSHNHDNEGAAESGSELNLRTKYLSTKCNNVDKLVTLNGASNETPSPSVGGTRSLTSSNELEPFFARDGYAGDGDSLDGKKACDRYSFTEKLEREASLSSASSEKPAPEILSHSNSNSFVSRKSKLIDQEIFRGKSRKVADSQVNGNGTNRINKHEQFRRRNVTVKCVPRTPERGQLSNFKGESNRRSNSGGTCNVMSRSTSDVVSGSTSDVMNESTSDVMSGSTSDVMSGSTSGQMSGSTSGQMSGSTSGQMSGSISESHDTRFEEWSSSSESPSFEYTTLQKHFRPSARSNKRLPRTKRTTAFYPDSTQDIARGNATGGNILAFARRIVSRFS